MKVGKLIELLKYIPQDAELCVSDSYQAFHEFNFIDEGYEIFKRYNSQGDSKVLYCLNTHYENDGFMFETNPLNPDVVEVLYEHQVEINEILAAIGGEQYQYGKHTRMNQWQPQIVGGSKEDKEHLDFLKTTYWNNLLKLFNRNKAKIGYLDIKDKSLLECAELLHKINNLPK